MGITNINTVKRLLEYRSPTGLSGLLFVLTTLLLFSYWIFPDEFISGNASYWLAENQDITQYIAGFKAFTSEPWHFPILKIKSINYPIGTYATFMDIIPIFSVFLKLFNPFYNAKFNPFGYWVFICYILQVVGIWWVLKELRNPSWLVLATTVVFSLTFPALSTRIGHISLMSHWLIIFSFALYLRSSNACQVTLKHWIPFLFFSFYINIYLFAMVSSIFLATVLVVFKESRNKHVFLKFFIPFFVIICSLFITLLPLPEKGGVSSASGFGYYSMNVLSPFTGGKLTSFLTSRRPGQYEGFNYLGLGTLIFLGVSLFLLKGRRRTLIAKHKPLIFILIALSLYALSSKVFIGNHLLMKVPYPGFMDFITRTFRVPGRFFWPVGYSLIIFSIFVTGNYLSKKVSVVILPVLLLIQVYDIHPILLGYHSVVRRPKTNIISFEKWDEIIHPNRIRNIYFYPKFTCPSKSPHLTTLLPVMFYAASRELRINTGYIARYEPECNRILDEIEKSDIDSSLYVFPKEEFSTEEKVIKHFKNERKNVFCSLLDFGFVCYTKNKSEA